MNLERRALGPQLLGRPEEVQDEGVQGRSGHARPVGSGGGQGSHLAAGSASPRADINCPGGESILNARDGDGGDRQSPRAGCLVPQPRLPGRQDRGARPRRRLLLPSSGRGGRARPRGRREAGAPHHRASGQGHAPGRLRLPRVRRRRATDGRVSGALLPLRSPARPGTAGRTCATAALADRPR